MLDLRHSQCALADGRGRSAGRHRLCRRADRGDRAADNGRCAAHDAAGCLCCAGLIETHIHLDKSRIVDRCAPEPSRSQPDHMRRVQAVKSTFTVEDIYSRAKATLEGCIKHGATRIRTHVEIDEPVGVKGVEALLQLAKEYAWAVDLEICVFPQEGLTNAPAADAALIKGLEMGARRDRCSPQLRRRPSRTDQAHLRAGAAIRRRYRHAHRFRPRPGQPRHASGGRPR